MYKIFINKEYIVKKIVKLTESDLSRIVKRVIKEEREEEEMGDMENVITINEVFDEVVNALNELGEYDESMRGKTMRLAKDIMAMMRDELAYISENYEDALEEILAEGEGY
jgi:dGTP triphosphohydrolase